MFLFSFFQQKQLFTKKGKWVRKRKKTISVSFSQKNKKACSLWHFSGTNKVVILQLLYSLFYTELSKCCIWQHCLLLPASTILEMKWRNGAWNLRTNDLDFEFSILEWIFRVVSSKIIVVSSFSFNSFILLHEFHPLNQQHVGCRTIRWHLTLHGSRTRWRCSWGTNDSSFCFMFSFWGNISLLVDSKYLTYYSFRLLGNLSFAHLMICFIV